MASTAIRTLAFIWREAVKVLKASYPTKAAAMTGIQSGLEQYYRENPAGAQPVSRVFPVP